ncbi:LCP family protein [Corynebacterium endometrii]|uniref:Regulatory protein MsrR n=1 Tax=Corynebacterium endometrii TaxID=2488819 RepID=A0A4P7QIA1_9CORY|nr:LCP family protein [Corynebacterium endometrii]QCB29395.1 Regulatory protein MsrR [Corynebacterium endometrii]
MNSGDRGDYVLRADGTPLTDRYGRPVRRRQSSAQQPPRQQPPRQRPPQQRPPRREAPSTQPRYQTQHTRQWQAQPQQQYQPQQYQPQQQYPPQYQQQYPPQPQYQPSVQGQTYVAPRPDARRSKPHRRRKKSNPWGCIGLLIATVVVLSLAFVLWTDTRLDRVEALPSQQVPDTAGTNWLLVGSDSRQGLDAEQQAELGTGGDVGVGRTDTIMLLHIPDSGRAKLVSLPRDSYVNVPGFGEDKINSAFSYGGPALLATTVEQATGLRIDHYAEIGMGGLANVVDSLGGINICVQEPINDPLAGINLAAGCQDLRGPDALGYVRTRATAMGDLDRVARQREFFSALLEKVTSPGTFINPFKAVSLVNNTAGSFTVNTGDHVWHLARVALAMRNGVETETVPVAGFSDTVVGNVVLWDEAGAQALWDSMK